MARPQTTAQARSNVKENKFGLRPLFNNAPQNTDISWSNERSAFSGLRDKPFPASDAGCPGGFRRSSMSTASNQAGCRAQRQGEDQPTTIVGDAAGSAKSRERLVARIHLAIKNLQICQPLYRQAVRVSLPIGVAPHEVARQPLSNTLCLGAVGECAIDIHCAINWQYIHWFPGTVGRQVTGCAIVPRKAIPNGFDFAQSRPFPVLRQPAPPEQIGT